jgi:hypothetical protein
MTLIKNWKVLINSLMPRNFSSFSKLLKQQIGKLTIFFSILGTDPNNSILIRSDLKHHKVMFNIDLYLLVVQGVLQ